MNVTAGPAAADIIVYDTYGSKVRVPGGSAHHDVIAASSNPAGAGLVIRIVPGETLDIHAGFDGGEGGRERRKGVRVESSDSRIATVEGMPRAEGGEMQIMTIRGVRKGSATIYVSGDDNQSCYFTVGVEAKQKNEK
jgi:hypothetical protein